MVTVAAMALSVLLLAVLCVGDPKRRRTARLGGDGHGKIVRRAVAAASLLPGLVLAATGDSAAFLIWIGGYAVAGWTLANGFRPVAR